METFKIRDVIQDLKRYLIEFDTNIVGIKKEGSKIIFEVEDAKNIPRKSIQNISKEAE